MELTAEKRYQLLLDISQQVRNTLDLDVILNHLLDLLQTITVYDAGGIFVLNQDLVHPRWERPRHLIAGIARRGFPETPADDDPMLTLGKGIIGHVIRTGEVVVAPDVRGNPHYVEGHAGTLSEIAVPIFRGGRAIGALNLESNQLGTYTEKDVEVLQFFADAAGISIEKAMLHQELLEKGYIEKQLQIAQQVQARLLPSTPPEVPGYDIAGLCIPTYEIGGDYFDHIELGNGRLGLVVADVSGEGIPAALIMTAFRALLRTYARSEMQPAQIMRRLNRFLPDFTGQVDFVTAVYGILTLEDGRFTYTNCGHNPPLLFRANGSTELLQRSGPMLSIIDNASYDANQITLQPGDTLLLYTDGVVEIINRTMEEFGMERLANAVRRHITLPSAALLTKIVAATQAFCEVENYSDDFTLLVVKHT